MEKFENKVYTGERAMFFAKDAKFLSCRFFDGESPLKHSRNVYLKDCVFDWKYPAWYSEKVSFEGCTFTENARAGVWYTEGVSFVSCKIDAPKILRRTTGITLSDCTLSAAKETLWSCDGVKLLSVKAFGADYFAMNTQNLFADGLTLHGNYGFDGCKNITIKNSYLLTKDSFWNAKDVVVVSSVIEGEYVGWNSENVTFINCTIRSIQGFCYMKNVKLINCRLGGTNLAFEYSTVDARFDSIDSVKNPLGGIIVCDAAGEIIIEQDRVDKSKTKIIVNGEEYV